MALKMDRRYLEEHMQSAHSLESLGAFVVDFAMRQAIEKIGGKSVEKLEVSVPVTITPVTLRRSLSIEDAAALGEQKSEGRTTRGITIDCVSIGVGVPPVILSVHLAI